MSLFKKRKNLNTIRQRRFGDDDEDELNNSINEDNSGISIGQIVKKEKKKKDKSDKKQIGIGAVLSFGDELEGIIDYKI